MATYKVLLDKRRQLKDGKYPLVVRIYNGDHFKDISLKTHLEESQFDVSSQKVNSGDITSQIYQFGKEHPDRFHVHRVFEICRSRT